MGYSRNRELLEDESGVSVSLSEALIWTTMCIVGLPVDVHVKDGSVYSGIFHTACVDNNYGIILKRARMTKKGTGSPNVANGGLIETLVVLSEDLVQVVAKEVLISADGIVGNSTGNHVEDIAGAVCSIECAESEAKTKHRETNLYLKQTNETRSLTQNGTKQRNGIRTTKTHRLGYAAGVEKRNSDSTQLVKKGGATSATLIERQVGDDRSQEKHGDYEHMSDLNGKTAHDVQGSSSSVDGCRIHLNAIGDCGNIPPTLLPDVAVHYSPTASSVKLDDQCQERRTSDNFPSSDAISSGLSASVNSLVYATSESCLDSSASSPTPRAPSRSSVSNRSVKEFKLNPGAKIFCPSFSNHRSTTPPAVPAVTGVTYIPDNFPMVPIAAAEPEVEISSYAHRASPPVKFVPYSNLLTGNDGSDSHYPQPIVGHVGSRSQPVRYAGQYHPLQAGPTYVHPSSLNVMVGRLGGQLVYVHPVSHDVTQGAAALSQVSTRPLLTPHQVHLPKHQGLNTINHGSAAAQALQVCVTPTFVGNGQQPLAVPSHIPHTQPPFPVIRPISLAGSNGYFSTKF